MHIFQFELGDGKKNIPLKKGFKNNNIFYTGTHDNQTILSYYVNLDTKYKNIVDKECKIGFYDKPNLKIIEFAFNQNCDYVIIPIQDYLGLTDDIGRMNTPGTSIGNWQFRCLKEDFSSDLASYISDLNYIYKK
jgi:4-alpha-glucanotransferase